MLINQPALRVALQVNWAGPERVAKRVRIAPFVRPIKCLEHYSPSESISQMVSVLAMSSPQTVFAAPKSSLTMFCQACSASSLVSFAAVNESALATGPGRDCSQGSNVDK